MNVFWKAAGVVVLGAICSRLVKQQNPTYSFLVQIASAFSVGLLLLQSFSDVLHSLNEWSELLGGGQAYFSLFVKAIAVCILSQLLCEGCRDSGNGLLASVAELSGRVGVLLLCLPMVKTVLEIALSMLE